MRIRSLHTERLVERAEAVERVAAPAPAEALSELEAARYIGMSAGWLKKSRTRRFRNRTDAPPFVRAGARRIVYRRKDLDAWLADRVVRHPGVWARERDEVDRAERTARGSG